MCEGSSGMGARGGIVRLCAALTLCPLTFQGMITLILATDMARHAEIMDSFKEKMENFDYSNEEHMTLVRRLGDLSGGLVHESRPPAQPGSRDTRILTLALEGGVTQAGFQSHTSYPGEPPRGPLSCLGASFPIPPVSHPSISFWFGGDKWRRPFFLLWFPENQVASPRKVWPTRH